MGRVKVGEGSLSKRMEDGLKKVGGMFWGDLVGGVVCVKYELSMGEKREIRVVGREGMEIRNRRVKGYMDKGMWRVREFMEDVLKEFVEEGK